MSAHVNAAMVKAVQDDERHVEWLESQLQWKYGYVGGQRQYAKELFRRICERFALDIAPAPGANVASTRKHAK